MKKLVVFSLFVIMAFSLAVDVTAQAKLKVGLIVMDMANEYFVTLSKGTKAYCDKHGYDLTIVDGKGDPQVQVTGMENLISAGCQVIDLRALDGTAMIDAVKEATSKGIFVNTYPDIPGRTTINTNDEYGQGYAEAKLCAEWFKKKFNGVAEYAILSFPENVGAILRINGIKDAFAAFCPGAKDVGEVKAVNPQEGVAAAETLLQAHPNLKAIIGINDGGALGAYEAATAAKKTADNFFVSGIDGDSAAIDAVAHGNGIYKVSVAGGLLIDETAYQVMANLVKGYLKGKYDKECKCPVFAVTKDNVQKFKARMAGLPNYAQFEN
jgi:ribose transport system substrate-binding protein